MRLFFKFIYDRLRTIIASISANINVKCMWAKIMPAIVRYLSYLRYFRATFNLFGPFPIPHMISWSSPTRFVPVLGWSYRSSNWRILFPYERWLRMSLPLFEWAIYFATRPFSQCHFGGLNWNDGNRPRLLCLCHPLWQKMEMAPTVEWKWRWLCAMNPPMTIFMLRLEISWKEWFWRWKWTKCNLLAFEALLQKCRCRQIARSCRGICKSCYSFDAFRFDAWYNSIRRYKVWTAGLGLDTKTFLRTFLRRTDYSRIR